MGEQQKSGGQPLLAGVEKLIDQVLSGAHRCAKHVGYEKV